MQFASILKFDGILHKQRSTIASGGLNIPACHELVSGTGNGGRAWHGRAESVWLASSLDIGMVGTRKFGLRLSWKKEGLANGCSVQKEGFLGGQFIFDGRNVASVKK